ncbi:acylneuraminate cytidylyltransferase family protein [Nitrosopumilus sp.]|jgi:CMP-N,N'-diacetyllegionaminic acid synthase|nr:acylneuraminate cytidylyltransferase family protein [Nitrosopumilus sp.]
MLKPICIIPARGGSKGVKRKNIRVLGKKPLISHTIKSALESDLFQDVIVSTEDAEIAEIAEKYNAKIPFMRPKKLAKDATTTEEVLLHTIKELRDLKYDFNTIMLRDCTVPFIDIQDMKKALQIFYKNKCDAVFASIKAHPNPYFGMMEIKKNGYLVQSKIPKSNVTRRQDSPIVYNVDGMFILNVKHFLKTKKISSGKIIPFEITKEHGHMIDFEFDFKIAELLVNSRKNKI